MGMECSPTMNIEVVIEESDVRSIRNFIWILGKLKLNSNLRCWSLGLHGVKEYKLCRHDNL